MFLPGEAKRWRENDYLELKKLIEHDVPAGYLRIKALERIQILDCNNKRKDLASCDPKAKVPPSVTESQRKIERAGVDAATHAKALKDLLSQPPLATAMATPRMSCADC